MCSNHGLTQPSLELDITQRLRSDNYKITARFKSHNCFRTTIFTDGCWPPRGGVCYTLPPPEKLATLRLRFYNRLAPGNLSGTSWIIAYRDLSDIPVVDTQQRAYSSLDTRHLQVTDLSQLTERQDDLANQPGLAERMFRQK